MQPTCQHEAMRARQTHSCVAVFDFETSRSSSLVAASLSANGVGHISVVTLRRARSVPGWVTAFGRANHIGMQPATQANSASYPMRDEKWVSATKVWRCSAAAWGVNAGWLIPYVNKRMGAKLIPH